MFIDLNLALYILIATAFVLIIWLFMLHRKIATLTKGASGKSLEDIIGGLIKKSQDFEAKDKEFEKALTYLNEKVAKSVRAVGVVRFNAFGESGGNQSFAIALCDEDGDGFILSTLCGRERTSFYVKELSKFISKTETTPEEKKAVDIAKKNLK